jgi:hypothetical protein
MILFFSIFEDCLSIFLSRSQPLQTMANTQPQRDNPFDSTNWASQALQDDLRRNGAGELDQDGGGGGDASGMDLARRLFEEGIAHRQRMLEERGMRLGLSSSGVGDTGEEDLGDNLKREHSGDDDGRPQRQVRRMVDQDDDNDDRWDWDDKANVEEHEKVR